MAAEDAIAPCKGPDGRRGCTEARRDVRAKGIFDRRLAGAFEDPDSLRQNGGETMNPAYRLKYRHQTLARAALVEAARMPDQVAIFVDHGSDEIRR